MTIRRMTTLAAVVAAIALAGCGGSDESTTAITADEVTSTALTPEEVAMGLDVPLCSEVDSIEDLDEDGNCRERPTCAEVDDGAELPADGVCLDVSKEGE